MTEIETVSVCPLGMAACSEIVGGKIHKCAWLVRMKGRDAAGDDHDEDNCAMSWQPILITEVAGAVRQTSASVQSMRNLTDQRQKEAIQALENHNV